MSGLGLSLHAAVSPHRRSLPEPEVGFERDTVA